MRIIAKKTLANYWSKEPIAKNALEEWYKTVEKADWTNHNDLKEQFGNASIIDNTRVVFNIHGNKYRLITDVAYPHHAVFITWVGTHKEYDKINVRNVQYNPDN
jgi:mRNA interferase HigB